MRAYPSHFFNFAIADSPTKQADPPTQADCYTVGRVRKARCPPSAWRPRFSGVSLVTPDVGGVGGGAGSAALGQRHLQDAQVLAGDPLHQVGGCAAGHLQGALARRAQASADGGAVVHAGELGAEALGEGVEVEGCGFGLLGHLTPRRAGWSGALRGDLRFRDPGRGTPGGCGNSVGHDRWFGAGTMITPKCHIFVSEPIRLFKVPPRPVVSAVTRANPSISGLLPRFRSFIHWSRHIYKNASIPCRDGRMGRVG